MPNVRRSTRGPDPRFSPSSRPGHERAKPVHLDAEGEDHPPKEFLFPDEHLGARPADRRTPPSGSVSIYRLVRRDEERGGYVYKVERRH